MQLSNGSCKHTGVKTPLASCSYRTLLFHPTILRSESALQNLAWFYGPVKAFILPCPLLWSPPFLIFLSSPPTSLLILSSLIRCSPLPFSLPSSHSLSSALLSIAFSSPLWSSIFLYLLFSMYVERFMLSMTWLEQGRIYSLAVAKQFIYLSAWLDPFLWKADCL